MSEEKQGNGFGHLIAVVSAALVIFGILVTVMIAVFSAIGARIDEVRATAGARIDEVRNNALPLREHLEYKGAQELTSRHNLALIEKLQDQLIELRHQVDRGCAVAK
jgi:predicted PurR-regulated permease PerM